MGSDIPWNQIQRYLSGRATSDDLETLKQWKLKDVANERLLEKMQRVWELSAEGQAPVDTGAAWERFCKKYMYESEYQSPVKGETEEKKIKYKRKIYPSVSSSGTYAKHLMAAAVLLLLMLFGISYYLTGIPEFNPSTAATQQITLQELNTGVGERAEVTFTDGSRIVLNAASNIRFPREFNEHRRVVYLDGEAYFEVVSNKNRPFIIKTEKADVRVLGTKFNVQAWSEDRRMDVAVREGKVAVQTTDTNSVQREVILEKSQRALLGRDENHFSVNRMTDEKFLYWLKGGLSFYNTPLPNVFKRLERRFQVKIEIVDEEIATYKYSGAFREADLEEALEVLSVSLDVQFELNQDRISVRAR